MQEEEEEEHSLTSGTILDFLNSSYKGSSFNICHYSDNFFWWQNIFVLTVEFSQEVIPYDMMELK